MNKEPIPIFIFLNFLLGLITFMPCLMVGAMSMDSPQAQNDPIAHIVSNIIMSFPLVCWICAALSCFIRSYFIVLFPLIESTLFIFTLWMLSK